MATTGITELTPGRHVFGAGAWFRNYDVSKTPAAQASNIIGATRGGNEITIDQEFVNVGEGIDGALGKIKGMTHRTKDTAKGKMTLIDIDLDALIDRLPGCSVAYAGDVATITRTADVTDADYLTNIAWVGDHAEGGDGTFGIVISNPLSYEPLVVAPADKDGLGLDVTFEAHYDATAPGTAPWSLFFPSPSVIS